MNIPKITREVVQEVADIGMCQVPGFIAPSQFSKWEDDDWEEGEECGLAFKGSDLEGLLRDLNYRIFGKVAKNVLRIAGDESANPNVRVTLKSSDPLRRAREAERFAGQHHTDSHVIDTGFSILCPIDPRKDEVLHSAGRGVSPQISEFQQVNYTGGAVIMAQRNFGSKITEGQTGQNWHVGLRQKPGKLIIVDVSPDDWPI